MTRCRATAEEITACAQAITQTALMIEIENVLNSMGNMDIMEGSDIACSATHFLETRDMTTGVQLLLDLARLCTISRLKDYMSSHHTNILVIISKL